LSELRYEDNKKVSLYGNILFFQSITGNVPVYNAARCAARFGRTKFAEQMLAAAKLRANRKHWCAG